MADESSSDASDTSHHAVECKWSRSAVQAGYVEDAYIRYFTEGKKHGPIHNMLHFLRITAIRRAVTTFIEQFPEEDVQLVNLGCGFDTLAFWVLQQYPNATCFEADKPEQLQAKATMIRNASPVMQLLKDYEDDGEEFIVAKRYKMVPADLNNIAEIETLVPKYGFSRDCSQPTLFLSEFSLVYLGVENSNEIIKFANKLCNRPSCFVYWEPTRIEDKFGQLMLERYREFGSELHGSIAYPTIESQIKRYTELGWQKVAIMDMNTLYNALITDEEKKRVKVGVNIGVTASSALQKLECLDEVEEIVIVCQHYVIGICGNQPEKLSKLFGTFTQTEANKTIRTYTTEEVREMIRSGTLSEMQPAPLNTGWLS
ncbi:hypothetical protein BOVATA_008690 [Babesia ovata]|uniref:Leucine carboxyl methyltransferase 1 n=1 Tax=Babesia ovata TaxID=189622 RepID=A0A2H6K8Q3_9APIC|nr:uncharacterized protein BOVATA_008690 [Babesia ovata]GBE59376.1 hypothetical protein BOVATA_008690 [Babesia ovata]